MNSIVKLGFHYHAICKFVDEERMPSAALGIKPSAYRRAFASGLEELLEVYRIAVHQLLQLDTTPVLAQIKWHLAEFMVRLTSRS